MKDFAKAIRNFKMLPEYRGPEEGGIHGSYEWIWTSQDPDGLARFVTLAITREDGPWSHQVEVWAGADDDRRFVRRLVAHFGGVNLSMVNEEPVRSQIQGALIEGTKHASMLEPGDLTESRPVRAGVDKLDGLL